MRLRSRTGPDEAVESLRFGVDRLGGAAHLVIRPIEVRVGQAAGRGADAGQWRSQVVRNRVEQRALEGVAPSRDLGARCLAAQAIASEAESQLIGRQ